jgi:hypothetical protein
MSGRMRCWNNVTAQREERKRERAGIRTYYMGGGICRTERTGGNASGVPTGIHESGMWKHAMLTCGNGKIMSDNSCRARRTIIILPLYSNFGTDKKISVEICRWLQ